MAMPIRSVCSYAFSVSDNGHIWQGFDLKNPKPLPIYGFIALRDLTFCHASVKPNPMPVYDINAFKAQLNTPAPLIGLDLGEKTIGVAISDDHRILSTPLELIKRTKFTHEAQNPIGYFYVAQSRWDRDRASCVNGWGLKGPRCQSVRAFGRNLMRIKDVPIVFWDERWSFGCHEPIFDRRG